VQVVDIPMRCEVGGDCSAASRRRSTPSPLAVCGALVSLAEGWAGRIGVA
jgi:hypothetical protein